MATVLLGEDDSEDLGQRPGQASWERGAWREIHTPASTHSRTHPGPGSPRVSTSELCTLAPGPRPSPSDPSSEVRHRAAPLPLAHPQGALSSEGVSALRPSPSWRSGRVGTQRGQPSPRPLAQRALDCLSGLSQARSRLRAGPRPSELCTLAGIPCPAGLEVRSRTLLPATSPVPLPRQIICPPGTSLGPSLGPSGQNWTPDTQAAGSLGRRAPPKLLAGTTPGDTSI